MTWSIQQVARMSGVTARTLRYYDEIGLLHPDSVGTNGYRQYERTQVPRLQHILLLRDLGLDLVPNCARSRRERRTGPRATSRASTTKGRNWKPACSRC
jgi:DNA-binding transcriptional MerR regulator